MSVRGAGRAARASGRRRLPVWLCLLLGLAQHTAAFAWGDEGHEVIALIAAAELEPGVAREIDALLATDASGLTAIDIAHEATWADKYRDSDRDADRSRYLGTREWHYIDLELDGPDLDRACDGRPPLASGEPASQGPAHDCIVDKIEQFEQELRARSTSPGERRLALQFVLHLVGDLHQPLHAADDHDAGGNRRWVRLRGGRSVSLHQDWDNFFVARLGEDPVEVARRLRADVSAEERARWRAGTPEQWALESFAIARTVVYGALPAPAGRNHYRLPDRYVEAATDTTRVQLEKAGVRLAWLLNRAWHEREGAGRHE